MSTVCRRAGLRGGIYSNDHSPAHVHVIGGGKEAVFILHCPHGPPKLHRNYRFSCREVNRIKSHLDGALAKLCDAWRGIHGRY